MDTPLPLAALAVSNHCVVLCDLRGYAGPESPAWQLLHGTQDDVGRSLAAVFDTRGIRRIDDFGGVAKSFLCNGEEYLAAPPRTKREAAIFSFTPKNRLAIEGTAMARVACSAGYEILVLTVQKGGKFGKVWVLQGALRHMARNALSYYEDTAAVVDELKSSPEAGRVTAVHVRAPGYEDIVAQFADRTVSQRQYQQEVLESG